MKKYLMIALLVLVGIVASIFLIPGGGELALMQFKDKKYEEARDAYEKKLAEGEWTVEVVSALVDLHLQYGAVDRAIEVMQQFVEQNPTNLEARKELGKLYQYAQRPDDYLRNLEEVNRLEGSDASLRTMAEMYGATQQYDKQEPALEMLVDHNVTKEPHHYRQLVNLQASQKKYAEAVTTMREFRERFPNQFKFPEYELMISLLLDQPAPEEAYQEAKRWTQQTQSPREIARLVNILHYRGSAELAWRLLEPYDSQIEQFPELAAEKSYILVNQGKTKEAYKLLTWLYNQNKLPDSLQRDFMFLALQNGDMEIAEKMLEQIDVRILNEDQAISLLEMAAYDTDSRLRAGILKRLEGMEMSGKPLFAAMHAIVAREDSVRAKVDALDAVEMTPQKILMVAGTCASTGHNYCISKMLPRLEGRDLTQDDSVRVANLYLEIGKLEEAREIVDPLYQAHPDHMQISTLRAKIAAYEGDTVFVDRWLSSWRDIDVKNYRDMFFLAQDRGQTDTALFVAQKMYEDVPTEESRSLLVNALMATKRYETALPYLRELKSYSEQDKNNYLSVLMQLASKDPKYNQELANFAATQLRGNVAPSQKQALIYALLDAGRADLALPYIKEFAKSHGGEWVAVYADNLDKLGHHDEARDFRMQMATDGETPPKTRREIAYQLLDKGYKNDAMVVFSGLAAEAPADSPDVQQLLYLWGPRLTAEQLDWMTQRALASSQPEDRRMWVQYVSGYADADEMVALIDRNPGLMGDPMMLEGYLNALQRLGKLESMKERVAKLAEETNNTTLLRAYARAVNGYNMTRLAQSTYKKLNEVTSGDPESERNLGLISFTQADYSETKKYLQNYVDFRAKNQRYHKDDYQAYYYLAEAYRRDRDMEKAEPHYRKVLALLSEIKGPRTPDMEARAAQSMVALGDKQVGYQIFNDAMKQYPDDKLLRADYISTLIEQKDYAQAESLIQTAGTEASAEHQDAVNPLMVSASSLEGYRTFSNNSEILLEFPSEQDTQRMNLSEEELKNYPWLSYSTQGYDRALLVARPNVRLKLEPTSSGYMIVPETVTGTGNETAKFQKELALRYKMLQARIDLETGEHYDAAGRMRELAPENQDSGTLLGYAANAENFIGRWKSASKLLEQASAIMPENEDIQILRRDIYRRNSQHTMIDYEWFRIGSTDQNIWTASGLVFGDDNWEAGGSVQYNELDASDVQRVDGRRGDFEKNLKRAEIFVANENEDGQRIQGSLFANDDFLGAGAYYSWYHELGKTQVYAEYHRPNWDFIEGVIDSAVRDRIGLTHYYQIDPKWVVSGGVALNRYHVDDIDNVADSASVAGTVTRTLKESGPYVAANYALDAEYRLDNERRLDTNANRFKALMDSREVHSISLIAAENLTEDTEGLVQVGYSYERMTDANGPLLAAEVDHNMINDQLEAQIRASYGAFTKEDVGDTTRVGGHLKWRF